MNLIAVMWKKIESEWLRRFRFQVILFGRFINGNWCTQTSRMDKRYAIFHNVKWMFQFLFHSICLCERGVENLFPSSNVSYFFSCCSCCCRRRPFELVSNVAVICIKSNSIEWYVYHLHESIDRTQNSNNLWNMIHSIWFWLPITTRQMLFIRLHLNRGNTCSNACN